MNHKNKKMKTQFLVSRLLEYFGQSTFSGSKLLRKRAKVVLAVVNAFGSSDLGLDKYFENHQSEFTDFLKINNPKGIGRPIRIHFSKF